MNFKRFNGSTWETARHKCYGSGTDSLTAFPAQIQASGEALIDYTISGNTVQGGTPSPQAPVDVVGCGVRTGNLAYGRIENANISSDGVIVRLNGYDIAIGRVESGTVYTANAYVYAFYTNEPTSIGDVSYDGSRIVGTVGEPSTFTAPITGYVAFRVNSGEQAMLNSGSTALPYEPYGYKIPITVNGTEYPIYFGEAQTARRIKKLVLTGEEFFYKNSSLSTNYLYYAERMVILTGSVARTPLFCNELPAKTEPPISDIGINTDNNFRAVYFNFGAEIMNAQPSGNTVDGLKEYLATQYAAGTPVTVWYVLATPQTAIINEPLHKIGDYADTITMAQAGVAIPTSDGDNTITFGTMVKPSAMSATFKGWHPVQSAKVYDGNDWS